MSFLFLRSQAARAWSGLCLVAVMASGCATTKGLNAVNSRIAALEHEQARLVEVSRTLDHNLVALASAAQEDRERNAALIKLLDQLEQEAEPAGPPEPDPAARYFVPVGDAYVRGSAQALVTLVIYSDFQCPFCGRVGPTLTELEAKYGDDLRLVYKHNPLPFHDDARPAAVAAEAAGRQGKFWEMHDLLMANQRELDEGALIGYAKKLKLNAKRFIADRKDVALQAKIVAHQQEAVRLGARGTPSFFINGRFLSGAQPTARFVELIDKELAHARELVAGGTPKAAVYEAVIADAKKGL